MLSMPQTDRDALWKQRWRASGIWGMDVARQVPSRGMVVTTQSGTGQLYAWDVATGELRQLTHREESVFDGYLSPQGSYVYYLRDEGGSETGHYVRIPWGTGEEQDLTSDMSPYAALYRCAESDDGSMFAFTPTEAEGFPLYCIRLSQGAVLGAPKELHRSPKLVDDAALSYDGGLVVIATTEHAEARQYSLMVVSTDDGRRIGELSDLPEGSVRDRAFSPLSGDVRILGMADRSGYNRPLIWNPVTGERTDLLIADLTGDVEPLDWSLGGSTILLRQTYRASHQLYTLNLETGEIRHLDHPSGSYETACFGPEGRIIALWADSTHLPQVIALDIRSGESLGTVLAASEAPPARPLRSIAFRSSDGEEIQGWLGVPEGEGPFPAILSVHGGPHMVMPEFYDAEAQSWLDHGYAYLSINYRGSTTFGREFKEKIWGDLGHWEVEDMVAARDWLVEQGIAQSRAIVLTGASYGGYLTLMALGKYPHLWAAGMAMVAPADMVTEYYDGTDWSRAYLTAMLGGGPDEKPEQYAASSPITYAEQVQAPLLVIQGSNDLRCPPAQMERYASRMQELGKPFEIVWFDAGHEGLDTDQFIGFQERMLTFAYQVLSKGTSV